MLPAKTTIAIRWRCFSNTSGSRELKTVDYWRGPHGPRFGMTWTCCDGLPLCNGRFDRDSCDHHVWTNSISRAGAAHISWRLPNGTDSSRAAGIDGLEEMDGTGSSNRAIVHRIGRVVPNLLGVSSWTTYQQQEK